MLFINDDEQAKRKAIQRRLPKSLKLDRITRSARDLAELLETFAKADAVLWEREAIAEGTASRRRMARVERTRDVALKAGHCVGKA